MARPRTPNDLYVVNGWWLEAPTLVSPHFQTFDGLGINTNTVDVVDAGTNIKYKFSGQIMDAQEMTLTRTLDGSSDDAALDALFDQCIREGFKFPCNIVKLHHRVEIFRIALVGFRFVNKTMPSFDVNSEEKFLVSYTATCDYWYIV
jgi:hypothetical protein